jgi:hypothetical protein
MSWMYGTAWRCGPPAVFDRRAAEAIPFPFGGFFAEVRRDDRYVAYRARLCLQVADASLAWGRLGFS